jgi:hypothetical protein
MYQDPDEDDPITFAEAYAFNAMEIFGVQFHDAHPDYSAALEDELKAIEMKLGVLAEACHSHDSSSKEGGPYPAPKRLRYALKRLSELVQDELDTAGMFPQEPWFTSELALKCVKYWEAIEDL